MQIASSGGKQTMVQGEEVGDGEGEGEGKWEEGDRVPVPLQECLSSPPGVRREES